MHAKDRVEVSKIWITGNWLWSWSSYICDCCKWMKNCRDSSLSLSGLEARLPAFQLPMFMFAKCDALYRKDIFTIQWLCSQLWHVTVANQWTIVEIKLLATVGWKRGCQPFSCPCSLNVTHRRKETCSTGLFQESMPAFPFGIFKHPLPTRSRFLRATVGLTSSSAFFPSLHLQKKCTCLMQRSKPFGHGVVVSSKTCYKCSDCHSQLFCVTASNQWTVVEIELLAFFATVGWKWGCQRFSWRCSLNVTHRRKETCSTGLFQESIPAKFLVFFFARTFNSWRDQRVGKSGLLSWESQFSSNARVK